MYYVHKDTYLTEKAVSQVNTIHKMNVTGKKCFFVWGTGLKKVLSGVCLGYKNPKTVGTKGFDRVSGLFHFFQTYYREDTIHQSLSLSLSLSLSIITIIVSFSKVILKITQTTQTAKTKPLLVGVFIFGIPDRAQTKKSGAQTGSAVKQFALTRLLGCHYPYISQNFFDTLPAQALYSRPHYW